MKLRTGDHILKLRSLAAPSFFDATCSNGCEWGAEIVTRRQATELHAAHLDAVVDALRAEQDGAE